MLRVLKVAPGDHLLWAKQLRNYEAEGLLRDLHARNTQRTTPKKINKRRFDFTVNKTQSENGSSRLSVSSISKTDSSDRGEDDNDENKTIRNNDGEIVEFGMLYL